MPGYWFKLDSQIVKGDTGFKITLTFSDASTGSAVDISSWSFAYEANERSGSGGNITIANGAMTQSDSGTGTTDTVTIPFSSTSVNEGRYDQDIRATVDGEITTIARGTLTVVDSEQD